MNDPASEYTLLDLLLTNKEDADGDEIMEFKVLRGGEIQILRHKVHNPVHSYSMALQESRFHLAQGSAWQNLPEDHNRG